MPAIRNVAIPSTTCSGLMVIVLVMAMDGAAAQMGLKQQGPIRAERLAS